MANTSIEWTDKVWNPTTGCTKVSAGCLLDGVEHKEFPVTTGKERG